MKTYLIALRSIAPMPFAIQHALHFFYFKADSRSEAESYAARLSAQHGLPVSYVSLRSS
jgi:hypothetical protein